MPQPRTGNPQSDHEAHVAQMLHAAAAGIPGKSVDSQRKPHSRTLWSLNREPYNGALWYPEKGSLCKTVGFNFGVLRAEPSSEALEARPGEGESQGPWKPKSPQKLLQAGVSDFTGLGV